MVGETPQDEQKLQGETKEPEKNGEDKETNFQALKNRAKKPAQAALATAALIGGTIGVIKGAEMLSDDDSSPNEQVAAETIDPPPENSQEPQIIPASTQKPSPTPVATIPTTTPSGETQTPTPTAPAIQETPQPPQSSYEQIIANIQNSQLSEVEKTQAEQIISEIRQIEETRGEFITAYRQNTAENGEPLLLALTKQKYANVDPTQLPGYDALNPNAAYENQIFFLHDESSWQNQVAPQLENLSTTTNGAEIQQKIQVIKDLVEDQQIYLESDSQSGLNMEINTEFTPQNAQEQQNLESTLAHINELKERLPLFGNIEVHINNSNNNSSGYNKETDTYTINITIENPAITFPLKPAHTAHELIHPLITQEFPYFGQNGELLFVDNNDRFIRHFSPQQVVEIMTQEEKILSNPDIGRNYPSQGISRLDVLVLQTQISSQDLGDLANEYATTRYNQWSDYNPSDRIKRADIELLAQLIADYFDYRESIVSDSSIDLLDFQHQLLKS